MTDPKWRIVYDLLAPLGPNDVLTYDACADALDLDPVRDRNSIQGAVRRAARRNEIENKHAVEAIDNVGYRVVEPVEHARLAKGYQRRSSVALKSGHSKVVNVDLSGLDPETRKGFEVMALAFSRQQEFNRRLDIRQQKLEDAVTSVIQQTERSADEIAELRARLESLETRS